MFREQGRHWQVKNHFNPIKIEKHPSDTLGLQVPQQIVVRNYHRWLSFPSSTSDLIVFGESFLEGWGRGRGLCYDRETPSSLLIYASGYVLIKSSFSSSSFYYSHLFCLLFLPFPLSVILSTLDFSKSLYRLFPFLTLRFYYCFNLYIF